MTANYADQYNNGEIEEVLPRIWRVPVPLPDNPLNYLNSYFILGEDKTTIVDVGFDHPDCEKALDDALRKLDHLGISGDRPYPFPPRPHQQP